MTEKLDRSATRSRAVLETWLCTNTAIRRASRKLGQLYDDIYADIGLKATQVGVLIAIANGDTPTLQSLANDLDVQVSAVTHALRPLVRDGLVELAPDPDDGRSKRAALTALGRGTLDRSLLRWDNANSRVERIIGPEAAATLRTIADRLSSKEFTEAFLGQQGAIELKSED